MLLRVATGEFEIVLKIYKVDSIKSGMPENLLFSNLTSVDQDHIGSLVTIDIKMPKILRAQYQINPAFFTLA